MPDPRPLLVGEANPYGGDPRYALYPLPENSAGGRLCRLIMHLDIRDYLRRFDRRNLCAVRWRIAEARSSAWGIAQEVASDPRPVVLLGSKVCAAFGETFVPFSCRSDGTLTLVILPHPSGLCRTWNEPGAFERAREALRLGGVLPDGKEVLHVDVA